ncbi:MAG: septation protein A [Gammaproteobacteria bacterium]|nr:septation protein A [Gammaproteobacteria bacterium]
MKLLFDFFPVVAFYLTYNLSKPTLGEISAMIAATAVLMAATSGQMLYNWIKHQKVEKLHVLVLAMALVFGGATIYFHDPIYLIWKVTLVNWLFALAFIASHFIGEKPLIQIMMEHAIQVRAGIWKKLSLLWIGFFIALGVINLVVAKHVSFDTWVDFKLFGLMGLTLLFALGQGFYLARHLQESPASSNTAGKK